MSALPSSVTLPVPPLGEVLEFLRIIWAVDHALQRRSKRMAREQGVTGPQRFVIELVGRFPGITAKQLAALLYAHPSTLTVVVKGLERRGLVQRRPDPKDHRRQRIGLTAAGRKLSTKREEILETRMREVLETVSATEIAGARALLTALAQAL